MYPTTEVYSVVYPTTVVYILVYPTTLLYSSLQCSVSPHLQRSPIFAAMIY